MMKISRTQLLPRATNVRDAWLCIIATEGQKTEKRYFSQFGTSRVRVEVLSTGEDGHSSPATVLKRLDDYRDEYEIGSQDKLWLMVDVDRWPPHVLKEVCREANQCGIGLAVSNSCFELWLWLHHADVEKDDLNCKVLEKMLRERLGSYSKHNLNVSDYAPYVQDAVTRAQALEVDTTALWPNRPGTHVYKVVATLQQL